ncbi:hypothetical protein BDF20DRAFT_878576 [Mycotypha africana]|uniref:uncharacterized protein n=1 Tax=Mycotypha africana TaxID=64632 RepID=UPI002301B01C|nr:uncharacterized protein BDF20DRAFT_878576 [Mycotypha africana]KAI8975421.1 hypothetical protein BDF20DRAFT_878576 [Mycotypha africana]
MDPGKKVLDNLDKVPNLVDQEPSIVTPPHTASNDVSWEEYAKTLNDKRNDAIEHTRKSYAIPDDHSPLKPEHGPMDDFTISNWDANTGYQDTKHKEKTD